MSVCPGCGRCRECGHRASPQPVYPWYPNLQQPWPIPPYYVGDPMPGLGTIIWSSGANTGTAV